MKCPNCGAEVEGKYCNNCGSKLPEKNIVGEYLAKSIGVSEKTGETIANAADSLLSKGSIKNSVIGAIGSMGVEAIRAKAAKEEAERQREDEEKRWKREHPEQARAEAKEERKSIYRVLIICLLLIGGIIGFCLYMSAKEKGAA